MESTIDTTPERAGAIDGAHNSVEVSAPALRELLDGLIIHAHKDSSLPTINAALLRAEAGYLVGIATDRYRLGEGKIEVDHGSLSPSLVRLDDIKSIMPILKACKVGMVTLSRLGDYLNVKIGESSFSFILLDGTFPPSAHLFAAIDEAPVPVEGMAFNPSFFADYAKIAGKGAPVKVYFGGENKPMRIRITSALVEWRLLLMPMRYQD